MSKPSPQRRLIVNADDFGLSHSVNEAVIRAHRDGILTTASLMVNELACEEAVRLAREHPRLGVGLHLSLLCGKSALPPERIPGLVDSAGRFRSNPVETGMRFFFKRSLREQLRAEVRAQFDRFEATGLAMDHFNGHLHLHLHPTILPMVMAEASRRGIRAMRLTSDPLRVNARIAFGRWAYRLSHAVVFSALSAQARKSLAARGIKHTDAVFGLLQNARVDENYVSALLPCLPAGDSELYSHPALDEFKHELDALVSPRVRNLVRSLGIQLIRYQDL